MKSDVLAFGQGEAEELKETLAIRYERGENYYVIIPAQQDGSTVDDNVILNQLKRDFPHLGAFLIGSETEDQILVIPERRLVVLIREFLLMLRDYS